MFVGTPAYASPEQVLGEPATPRSDLFAFGVVLYELLTGTHPFRRETVADTMTAILRDDPPPLDGQPSQGVPAAALRVIEHCLEKQPSERPSSARDVAMFLDAAAARHRDVGARRRAISERPRVGPPVRAQGPGRLMRSAPGRRGDDMGLRAT